LIQVIVVSKIVAGGCMSAVLDESEVIQVDRLDRLDGPARLDRIMEFLSAEGFRPEKVSDFSIRLKVEGRPVWVDLSPQDDDFYQVIAANMWELEAEWEVQNAYQVCSHISNTLKVVKAYVITERNNVWIEASQFYKSEEAFLQHVVRVIDSVRVGVSDFVEQMRALKASESQSKYH